jgi:hypothetical protein
VRWPDRSQQVFYNVAADQMITLEMKKPGMPAYGNKPAPNDHPKLFSRVEIEGLSFRHKENDYDDISREGLMPHNLSAEGPALAVGDINRNGLDDLFIGGASGQAAMLFSQRNNGTFTQVNVSILKNDCLSEDVDAAFFDADGDGDSDLYIVRGGNHVAQGDQLLADRLLINNGKGEFSPCMKGSLPDMAYNGSCVRPADYDGDGDLDLFVGSRSLPGSYGLSPRQFLLENDGAGTFMDVTDHRTKDLKNAGMVTDATWLDYEQDGDSDLVLVGEWMKVTLYRNDDGYLTDITGEAGLGETSGWWNCIKVSDVDGDGDLDLVGGNLGLNSMLKATMQEPVEMYVNDFDNNGTLDQVICAYHKGISYPVASLDELAGQVTGLKNKYPSYSDFGGMTVKDIFGTEKLDQSIVKKAVLLESCVFLNHGNGTFIFKVLPKIAQFSPVRDMAVHDFNQDGRGDLVLVGNNYAVRPSIGRYDASYGWCLLGGPDHGYNALMPVESGLRIDGDARKIRPIEVMGKSLLVTAVNDGDLQVVQY